MSNLESHYDNPRFIEFIRSLPEDEKEALLWDVGDFLLKRWGQYQSVDDLERSISMYEEALICSPHDRTALMNNFANALEIRFELTKSLDDLDRTIFMRERSILSMPEHHQNRDRYLENLALALLSRYDITGMINDLDRTIELYEELVALTLNDHPNRSDCLYKLGDVLMKRFDLTHSIKDLDRAIIIIQEAVALTSQERPEKAIRVSLLALALTNRFPMSESMDDIERAIEATEQDLAWTSHNDPRRPKVLFYLGDVWLRKFDRSRAVDDLDRSIKATQQAITVLPNDHPLRVDCLGNMAIALSNRFERTGSLDDLDRSIDMSSEALELMSQVDLDYPGRLNNLGTAFHRRFKRKGRMTDLESAVESKEKALSLMSKDHPHRVVSLNGLGNVLVTRFERMRSIDDLNRGIQVIEEAISLNANTELSHISCVNNLAIAILRRFECTRSIDDLDRAISLSEEVAASTSSDHPNCAGRLINLANALMKRFEQTKSTDDFDVVIEMRDLATSCTASPAFLRISAAHDAARLLIDRDPSRAYSLLRRAIELLPFVSPRTLQQSDQQYWISRFSGLTATAVSLALECGIPLEETLQILELGRGILASLKLEVRSDISTLRKAYPDLAQRFDFIREVIDSVLSDSDPPSLAEQRSELSKELDGLLLHIRKLEGFERFLLGPSKAELQEISAIAPIVVFNISEIRSDAIITTGNNIHSIRLPQLQYSELEMSTSIFLKSIYAAPKDRTKAGKELNKVLEWLWDVALGPVLEAVGFTVCPSHGQVWPRIWWIGSGLLNMLPIHAAGYHNDRSGKTVLDRVISSYTPSIKALAYSRQRAKVTAPLKQLKAMLVAMPKTPGQIDLPYVEQEIRGLEGLFLKSPFMTTRVVHNPTRMDVLSWIGDHQIVHMSCHGVTEEDPAQSRLLLHDWKTLPLTVTDLTSANLESSVFAYLSACHTAGSRDRRLLEESINLSSAFQLAGYPSVIGTLWQILDEQSSHIAQHVYQWMLRDGERLDIEKAGEALHWATRELREQTRRVAGFVRESPSDPLVWGPYIHIGI